MTTEEVILKIEYMIHVETKWPGTEDTVEALETAISALRAQQEAENNDPLTLDELRKMDGEPVWCIDGSGCERWGLVNADVFIEVLTSESGTWEGAFYNMTGDGKMGLHPLGWVAYRHKPKEESNNRHGACEGLSIWTFL